VAVNLLRNEFFGADAYTQHLTINAVGTIALPEAPVATQFDEGLERWSKFDFAGTNATLGVMWRAWQHGPSRLTLAAVAETAFTADVHRRTRQVNFQDGVAISDDSNKSHLEIDFPWSATLGAALRLSDRTTVAAEVTWTEWSDWVQEDQDSGRRTRPIGAVPADTEIDDLYAVRVGVEHVLSVPAGQLPLRAGLFYDPRPGLGNEQGIYGFSLGSGLTTSRFSLDAAYQYRTGDDLRGQNVSADLLDTTFDVEEHLFIASLIWYL